MKKNGILGIDPGTLKTGYALIEPHGNNITLLASGVIRTKPHQSLPIRYHTIFKEICCLLKKYAPACISIETQFMQKNVASAMKIAMARASALIAATEYNLEIYEYSPTQVKKSISSFGHSTKEQIQKMTASLLCLKEPLASDDEADAVALSLCHHFRHKRIQYV